MLTLPYFHVSDDYNGVPPLDPEKLKIFHTLREITGLSMCFVTYLNMLLDLLVRHHIQDVNVFIFRHPKYPVVARKHV